MDRMHEYRANFDAGQTVAFDGDAGVLQTSPDCPALNWQRLSLFGTSGNAFDVATEFLLVSDSTQELNAFVETQKASDPTDSLRGSNTVGTMMSSSVMLGLPGYGGMHGDPVPPPELVASCVVVAVDTCTGHIGYVCRGQEFERQYLCTAASGCVYTFELEFGLSSAVRRRVFLRDEPIEVE